MEYITTQSGVEQLLPLLMRIPYWGVDTETTGLDPYKSELLSVQIGRPEQQFVIDARRVKLDPLKPFFASLEIKKILQNAKFDYKQVLRHCGIAIENMRCTMLGEIIYQNGRKGYGFGLQDLLQNRLGVSIEKETRNTFVGHTGDFTEAQLAYMADDVRYLAPLATAISNDLKKEGLAHTYLLECAAIPSIGDMELEGWYLDVNHWKELIHQNEFRQHEIKEELDEIAKQFLTGDLFGKIDLNYGSPQQVLGLLEAMRIKVRVWDRDLKKEVEKYVGKGPGKFSKTGKDELKSIIHLPVVQKIARYRTFGVYINTFGQSYIDAIHPVTGRLHTEVSQLGAESGRITSKSEVSFLNLPALPEFREAFRGNEDEVIETDDYSGCELRILAELSGDPGLLHVFREGLDPHCYAGTKLFRTEITKKDERRKPAKAINFGICYGKNHHTLFEDLNAEGFPITREETKVLYDRYEQEFHAGVKYIRDAGALAIKQGYIANMNGRKRWWNIPTDKNDPKYFAVINAIKREAGNHMIQSVNADITKRAMTLIREYRIKHNLRSNFVNQVYDEIVTKTHKDDSAHFHEAKVRIMKEAAGEFLKTVPMEVGSNVGRSWTK